MGIVSLGVKSALLAVMEAVPNPLKLISDKFSMKPLRDKLAGSVAQDAMQYAANYADKALKSREGALGKVYSMADSLISRLNPNWKKDSVEFVAKTGATAFSSYVRAEGWGKIDEYVNKDLSERNAIVRFLTTPLVGLAKKMINEHVVNNPDFQSEGMDTTVHLVERAVELGQQVVHLSQTIKERVQDAVGYDPQDPYGVGKDLQQRAERHDPTQDEIHPEQEIHQQFQNPELSRPVQISEQTTVTDVVERGLELLSARQEEEKSFGQRAAEMIGLRTQTSLSPSEYNAKIDSLLDEIESSNISQQKKIELSDSLKAVRKEVLLPFGKGSVEFKSDEEQGEFTVTSHDHDVQGVNKDIADRTVQYLRGKQSESDLVVVENGYMHSGYELDRRFDAEVGTMDIKLDTSKWKYTDSPYMGDTRSDRLIYLYNTCKRDKSLMSEVSKFLNHETAQKATIEPVHAMMVPKQGQEGVLMVKMGDNYVQLGDVEHPRVSYDVQDHGTHIMVAVKSSWDIVGHSKGVGVSDEIYPVTSDQKNEFTSTVVINIKKEDLGLLESFVEDQEFDYTTVTPPVMTAVINNQVSSSADG